MSQNAQSSSHADSAGSRSAPGIVLVHGSVVSRKMWLPQLGGLADGHRVIAPDLPGHGARADMPFSFASAVQSLAAVIREEAQGRALVAGLSLGGYVAIELAHSHPDLVAGLVLSGCSHNFTGLSGLYLRGLGWLMRRGWLRLSRAKAEERTRRMFPPALADVAEAQLRCGVYPEPLGASFAEMAGRDFAGLLATFPGPTLILNGERDSASRRGERTFAAAARHGRVQVITGAGHACNLDQPDAYNEALRAFAKHIGWPAARTG